MGLFTKYKSNFKKQAGWIWANKFVYSHPNSKHLEFARCPLLISAALVVAQAPSRTSASYALPRRRADRGPGLSLVLCTHQPALAA